VSIPEKAVAGDDWVWTWTKAGHEPGPTPDPGQVIEMILAYQAERLVSPGVSAGDTVNWNFAFAAADTALLSPNQWYKWYVTQTKDGLHTTLELGNIWIVPDPYGTAPIQPLSLTELTLIEAYKCRHRLVSSEVEVTEFQGHRYTLRNLKELNEVIRSLERERDRLADTPWKRGLIYHRFVKSPPA
jgi:hypothetical protein